MLLILLINVFENDILQMTPEALWDKAISNVYLPGS